MQVPGTTIQQLFAEQKCMQGIFTKIKVCTDKMSSKTSPKSKLQCQMGGPDTDPDSSFWQGDYQSCNKGKGKRFVHMKRTYQYRYEVDF